MGRPGTNRRRKGTPTRRDKGARADPNLTQMLVRKETRDRIKAERRGGETIDDTLRRIAREGGVVIEVDQATG